MVQQNFNIYTTGIIFNAATNKTVKGQLISKANCQAVHSSKKGKNEFVFTAMRRVLVRFLEEIEDTKKTFRNYLTFKSNVRIQNYNEGAVG